MRFTASVALGAAALVGLTTAHPGHDISQEIRERAAFLGVVKRNDLSHCAAKMQARGLHRANVARRVQLLEKLREKRGLQKRDASTDLVKSHNETSLSYTLETDDTTLFSGNGSCVLTPEATQGPYYVSGELIRNNVTESETGVDLTVDYQIIDVDTCEPVPNVYVEIWHCNATGVYSGVVSSGNGIGTDDPANINRTALRGIQETDTHGVVQFETIFPGHYTSRATHIHLLVHTDTILYENNTLGAETSASHVGQVFFDQDLITAVELIMPYTTNTQTLTTNAEDSILNLEAATEDSDPLMEYTLLGDTVSEGLLAWLSFGINTTSSTAVTPAAFHYANGGIANSDAGMGGTGPNGTGMGRPSNSSVNSTTPPA